MPCRITGSIGQGEAAAEIIDLGGQKRLT